ncbi:MAG: hypothetical protein F7C07_03860 [Desulfurococcales archaeon]|nr:hypothetical protein [Desulfurococcales archaeon]
MQGELVEVIRDSGDGFAFAEMKQANISLGTVPGARKYGQASLRIPRPSNARVKASYLSVGVMAGGDYAWGAPVRLKIDGSTVAREYKPQFSVEVDEGFYYKAIYDITPLVSKKLLEKSEHKLGAFYEHLRPLRLSDACLLAVYESGKGSYSISYHTGAVSLQPGEVLKVNMRLPKRLEGTRKALVGVYLPSSRSYIKVVAGGSDPLVMSGPGFATASIEVPYRGLEVPVAVIYEKPETSVYPKTVVVTDVIVVESIYPKPDPRVIIESKHLKGEEASIEGTIVNNGDETAQDLRVYVTSLGIKIAENSIGDLEPGKSSKFVLKFNKKQAPHLAIRVEWTYLGLKNSRTVDLSS